MAADARLICASDALRDGEQGVRFTVDLGNGEKPAFVIRYRGRVHAYLNECAHVPVQLDLLPGEFFDYSKLYLVCATHGALYAPDTGRCLSSRCAGRGLKPLPVFEAKGSVFLEPDNTK